MTLFIMNTKISRFRIYQFSKGMYSCLIGFLLLIPQGTRAQTDSLQVGYAPKGTRLLLMDSIPSSRKLKKKEPFRVVLIDSSDAIVLFRDSSFGIIKNYLNNTIVFNIENDTSITGSLGDKGPKPPRWPIGGPGPVPFPRPPRGPSAHEFKPITENEMKQLMKEKGITKQIKIRLKELDKNERL